jgi:hypothetical protein
MFAKTILSVAFSLSMIAAAAAQNSPSTSAQPSGGASSSGASTSGNPPPTPPPSGEAMRVQLTSFSDLLSKGYEVKHVAIVSLEIAKGYSDKSTMPAAIVTLQRGNSAGVCYFGIRDWIDGKSLDAKTQCDERNMAADVDLEFMAPPGKTNAMWRINRTTAEVGYCFFDRPANDPIGRMVCAPPDASAGASAELGPYGIEKTNFPDEFGIVRVNRRTGAVSMCYMNEKLFCTPFAK